MPPEELAQRIAALGAEPRACLVCAASAPRRLFFRDEKWFWNCPACELVWVHDIYPEFVRDVGYLDEPERYAGKRGPRPKELRTFRALFRDFAPYRRSGRLLEVGCAVGTFLAEAARAGWRTTGVEILPALAQEARAAHGLDVRTGDLFEAELPAEEFDVVYMNEVIEHVVEPVPLLAEVRRVLRPGGLAVLRTGNARSWSARWRGARWEYYHFGGHDHIRYYSPRAADALARAAGLTLARCATRGFAWREARELRGHWYRPAVQLAQALVSPLARPLGSGHRLTAYLEKPERAPSGGAPASESAESLAR
jgi:SAM-dependent methyltransferase